MPDRTLPILGAVALALFVVYVGLVITTISFAAWQTQTAHEIGERETRIAKLEATYYEQLKRVNATDPHTVGLTRPVAVRYVTAVNQTAVSFAGR